MREGVHYTFNPPTMFELKTKTLFNFNLQKVMQKDSKALATAREELKNRVNSRGSQNHDSGMPVVAGTILSITGYTTENKGQATEYTNFTNVEGATLSDKHIGRRGNGLNLTGNTNFERINTFMDEIDAAKSPIKVKVVNILSRKALYDGRETLNNYYVMERV